MFYTVNSKGSLMALGFLIGIFMPFIIPFIGVPIYYRLRHIPKEKRRIGFLAKLGLSFIILIVFVIGFFAYHICSAFLPSNREYVRIFTDYGKAKPNEVTKEQFFGEYYHIFPLGEFVLEFKPFDGSFKPVEKYDGIYQLRIYYKSGRFYKSEWQTFRLGLADEEPYVGLSDFKDDLLWDPFKEPTDAEISAYKSTYYTTNLHFNYYHEIVIWLGIDPDDEDSWYAKRSKKYKYTK